MERTVLLGGPRSNPYRSEEVTMMRFFSEKGTQGRPTFESMPIYFDGDLW